MTLACSRSTAAAIEHAIAFLLGRRDRNGWWADFDTLAGPSTEWVSAYVALALAQTNHPAGLDAARATWTRLRWRRWWSPGWGYNGTVPSDADTTIWALHLARAIGVSARRRTLRFLSSHVTLAGGVATYARVGPIRAFTELAGASFAGWCSAHACVSAAGAGLPELPQRERVVGWLRDAQGPEGNWKAYWWPSQHYTTALACEALAGIAGPGDASRVSRAVRWTERDIAERGLASSPFDQAFALRTLLLGREAGSMASWVLDHITYSQLADGSWPRSARLRIPPPDVTDPDAYGRWVEGGRGGGSIQSDQNACFTTAAVLQALIAAERHQTAALAHAHTPSRHVVSFPATRPP
jgi:squalene-hopene/tetraprenyl-beta-curcumene cyclase